MTRANDASISWTGARKQWTITIHVGAEFIKRSADKRLPHDAPDEQLRAAALETARNDSYELVPESVGITR